MIRNMTQVRANAIISCALAFLISALTPRVAQAGCNNSPPTCGDPACGRAWCNDNRLAHWQCIASPAGTPCANGGSCTGNVAFGGGETFLDFNCALPGVVSPDFYITHVVYAVPGKSSSMFYASGYTMGSTTSATNSMQQSVHCHGYTKYRGDLRKWERECFDRHTVGVHRFHCDGCRGHRDELLYEAWNS